jgi:Chalcone isomerase-like
VIRRLLLSFAASLFVAAPVLTHAQTTDVDKVKYDNTTQLAGAKLVLNGAGIRYKAIFKVYTAGLYLTTKATTPEAVLAAPGPKRMHIVMLRDIDGNELGKLFTRGMQDNAPREEFSKSIAGTLRMADIFSAKKKLFAGDHFYVDWVPGVGTSVVVNDKAQSEPIKEPEFFSALLKIWLGNSPADSRLKEALLGKTAPGSNNYNN